jgi:hypothetical protein
MANYRSTDVVGTSTNTTRFASSLWPWWTYAIVIVGALLMAMGAIIALVNPAMLVAGAGEINGAVRIYAGYLVSRNLALAAMLLIMLAFRVRGALSSLMVLTAFVQLLDAVMDLLDGRWPLVPGVLIFALAFFLGAKRLSGHAFWKSAAWRSQP